MIFRSLIFASLSALPSLGCSEHSSKAEKKKPSYVEINQPASLIAFNSPGIIFSLKTTDGSVYADYNKTVTIKRRLIKNEGCPGDAKSLHEENVDLNFVSGVATLDTVFERPGRYLLGGTIPDWNLMVSTPVEVTSSLAFEFQSPEFIRAGQTNFGKIKKTARNSDLTVIIKWSNPSDLDPMIVSIPDDTEQELVLISPLTKTGEAEFQLMESSSSQYFPCRLRILSGRIKKAELGMNTETGMTLKFFDEYGNPFLDTALMKYSIIRASDSQMLGENVSWIDGRAGYKIRDQIPPGDYSIRLQFKESGETALGSEVSLPFRL